MSVPDDDDDDGGVDDATRTATARLYASSSSATTTEAYLREDVACGSAECSTHARANARAGCADVLASVADGARWYVIFDADCVTRYAEAIERGCVENVIVARSTLRRLESGTQTTLRGRAARAIRRAGADKRLRVHVFDDEHCAGTSRVGRRLVGMARASRECATAAYYAEKVRGKFPIVVVVSDDAHARAFAEEEHGGGGNGLPDGVIVTTGRGFVERFLTTDADADARSAFDAAHVETTEETTENVVGTSYEPHWSEKDIEEGLESGNLITGALEVKTLGVVCEGCVAGVFIPSKRAMNRAFHGDVVVVALEPEERWTSSRVNTVMDEDETAANILASDDVMNDAAVSSAPGARRTRTGRVVGVVRRRIVDVVACLDSVDEEDIVRNPHAKRNGALCVPMDGKIVKIKLLTRRASDLVGARFVVRVDEWRTNQRYPNGHLIKILGAVGDVDGEMAALLARYDVPTDPFGAQALAELPREGSSWTVPDEEYATRRDLRHHRACSIDPPGCTDVDDALSVHFLPEVNPENGGSIEIGVHIADVSHFVRPGTLLDYEAQLRGTTVYLVDRRLDMLPSLLSENLASLLEKRDRLALSCVWTLNERLDVVDAWFGKSVIHSRHQMTYHQAQAIYDGVSTTTTGDDDAVDFDVEETDVVRRDLKTLVDFASKVNAVRASHGAVELESAELRFETDAQTKSPTEVIQKREVPMMRVVAELMILANSAAAKTIHEAFPTSAFLRRHAPPREDGFAELKRLAAARDVELDCSSGEALNASLARISATFADSEIATLFKGLATRAMSEAQYVSSGSIPAEDSGFGHYGLALTHYTHFTSPIRRYADIIVHRQIVAALEQAPGGNDAQAAKKVVPDRSLAHGALEPIATHLNERNRASKRAQSRCGEIYLLWLLREKPLVEPAVIHEIREDGFLVFLPSFHIKASVRLRDQDGRAIAELASDDDLERVVVPAVGDSSHSHVRATPQTGVVDETTEMSDASIRVVKSTDGSLVRSYELLQKVWVRLSCRDSRAQGPKLDLRLLDAETHPGVAEAKISRFSSERPIADSAPSSLSSVMRRVIEETTTTTNQSSDKTKRKISVDNDDDDDDDDAVATKLNVSSKSSKRRVNSSSFSKLHIHDTTTTAVIITDDGPDANLRVHRNHRRSAPTPNPTLIHRQRAARAWARLASTRFFGARGRARYERRRQRVEERYAALR